MIPRTGTHLVLLGTRGGPRVSLERANPSNLVVVDGEKFLVDCGHGVTRRLLEAGVEPAGLRKILITHHHSDHTLELGPLLYNAWVGGLRAPIDVYGPPPLRAVIAGSFSAMAYDIGIRIADEGRQDPRGLVRVHEFTEPGLVLEAGSVRITSALVRHPPLEHCFAYRFDTPGRSIVLSGDTTYSPELIALARGADVLLHEVLHPDGLDRLVARNANAARLRQHLLASHTTTEQVGHVAAEAGVGMLVLNHFVPGEDALLTEHDWLAAPRRDFSGPVVMGRDLMVI
jgi:ribonuclease BN (tRNA processing enzyme)